MLVSNVDLELLPFDSEIDYQHDAHVPPASKTSEMFKGEIQQPQDLVPSSERDLEGRLGNVALL